jgi:quinoprotein glucose dehydrogenase
VRTLAVRSLLLLSPLVLACAPLPPPEIDYTGPTAEWREFAGTKGGSHFSPLTQIDRENVGHLEIAWTHVSGDFHAGAADHAPTWFQATPLVVGGTLYYNTPFMRVFALDPETGEERWMFDPELRDRSVEGPYPLAGRGVAYWEGEDADPGSPCQRRILYGTRDSELIALDADTGLPCADFGTDGRVALREGMGTDAPSWEYYPTSPPLVLGDIAVIGALVADNVRTDSPSGVVRAFDVRSGAQVWAWDPVPPNWAEDPNAGELYARGTPNVWSVLSGDEERGLVFVPTGNASPDAYSGDRRGLDHYSSSTVALDARTGEVVWNFQAVHHDVWDFDTPAQPQLVELPNVAGGRPAVVQPTKMGFLFVLDRETGEPLHPVEERAVPQDGVDGESLSKTQPFPITPPPLHPDVIEPWGFTPIDKGMCEREMAKYRWDGFYTPPTRKGSLQTPHSGGGPNWGGLAINPENGVAIFNQTELAMVTQLVPREEFDQLDLRSIIYPNEAYAMRGTPYGYKRWTLLSEFGSPCTPPPWGTLQAVDLGTGEVLWRVPLGSMEGLAPYPMAALYGDIGVPNFGGGLSTAGGIHFIGAATDRYFRAFDTATGEVIWRTRLTYGAHSTPMSFRLTPESKQFVVVAAGGNVLTEIGDGLVAFALPD